MLLSWCVEKLKQAANSFFPSIEVDLTVFKWTIPMASIVLSCKGFIQSVTTGCHICILIGYCRYLN